MTYNSRQIHWKPIHKFNYFFSLDFLPFYMLFMRTSYCAGQIKSAMKHYGDYKPWKSVETDKCTKIISYRSSFYISDNTNLNSEFLFQYYICKLQYNTLNIIVYTSTKQQCHVAYLYSIVLFSTFLVFLLLTSVLCSIE